MPLGKLMFRSLLLLAALNLGFSPLFAVFQNNIEIPFFQKVWRGSGDIFPKEVTDPKILRQEFVIQPRDDEWAKNAEKKINSALSGMTVGKIGNQRVQCKASLCEVLFLLPRISLPATDSAEDAFNKELANTIDIISTSINKEATMAITNSKDEINIGVMIYFHDAR